VLIADKPIARVGAFAKGRVMIRLFAALALVSPLPALAAAPIAGRYLTQDKQAIVEVGPCGTKVCGRIVRILAAQPKGPARDEYNPDPKLRGRPILGLTILSGFTDGGKQWNGQVYDPNKGKMYRSVLTPKPDGTLAMKGCIGPFCRTQLWTPIR
jgi:uncharacterized protein (DUF2147 family)